MRDEDRNAKLTRGGDGAYADAWIGHIQIHPAKGKREIGGVVCCETSLIGSHLRDDVPDTDFAKAGRRIIEPNESSGHSHHDTVHALYAGTANYDDWKNRIKSKRHYGQAPRSQPSDCTKRTDLYDIFQYQPVSKVEAARNAYRWEEDTKVTRARPLPVPGSSHPSTGRDMLYWKPDQRVANFVPYGSSLKERFDVGRATERVPAHISWR